MKKVVDPWRGGHPERDGDRTEQDTEKKIGGTEKWDPFHRDDKLRECRYNEDLHTHTHTQLVQQNSNTKAKNQNLSM